LKNRVAFPTNGAPQAGDQGQNLEKPGRFSDAAKHSYTLFKKYVLDFQNDQTFFQRDVAEFF
jgi:hypothetical protein